VSAARADTGVAPGWINRQGMRVLWSRFTLPALDSLLGFVEVAALNALATRIPEQAILDTASTRTLWKIAADRLQATSIRWFPAVSLAAIPSQGADEVDLHGKLTPVACGLDSLYWRSELRRLHPDVRFAFHASDAPADWFTLGLLRGFSSPDAPVLLWLKERRGGGRALVRRYRERGVYALSALGLEPDRALFAQSEW